MADNASKNPYIIRALETIRQNTNFSDLQSKLNKEGAIVIPNVVTLAFVLERLTSAMKDNWRFLRVCNEIWSEYDNLPKALSATSAEGNLFFFKKWASIEHFVKQCLLMFETKNMRKVTFKTIHFIISKPLIIIDKTRRSIYRH